MTVSSPAFERTIPHPLPDGAKRTLIVLAALITASGATFGQQVVEPYVKYTLTATDPVPTVTEILHPVGWQTASGASKLYQRRPSLLVGEGTAQIGGSAQVGSAKAVVSGQGLRSENAGNAASGYSAFVFAGWKDEITLLGGPEGERGLVTFDLAFDWSSSMNVLPGGYAMTQGFVDINLISDTPAGTPGQYQYANVLQDFERDCRVACVDTDSGLVGYYQGVTGVPQPTVNGKTASLTFSMVFGQTYMIDAAINAFVDGVESNSTLDASHSMNWAGIAQVVDESAVPLDFSVTAASGFDYVSAVPEPASRWALLLGLLPLAFATRRVRGSTSRAQPTADCAASIHTGTPPPPRRR